MAQWSATRVDKHPPPGRPADARRNRADTSRATPSAASFEAWDEDALYREIKGAAHEAVDDFLEQHRSR